MSFELIAPGDARWRSCLSASKAGIFYSPEYCDLHRDKDGSPAMLLYQDDLGTAFDVTAIKNVSSLPFYEDIAAQFSSPPVDLANPIYNGPLLVSAAADRSELLRRYRNAVRRFCADNNVVTEFVRFHPLYSYSSELGRIEELIPVSDILYVDLRHGYEAAHKQYRKGHKSAARKAARDGASWKIVEPTEENLASFMGLYQSTQRRKGTRDAYVQSTQFFRALFDALHGRALLAESYAKGKLVSSSIFLEDTESLWYQYSGSVLELLSTDAHTYLMDRMIERAASKTFSYLVLGGGGDPHDPSDHIAKFKRGFSHLVGKVYQLRRVHNSSMLEKLLLAKENYNRSLGRVVQKDWFPSYWLD